MLRSKRCRAAMQEPGKSIGPKPSPRRRTEPERFPIADRNDTGSSQRQRNKTSQQREFVANPIGQGARKHACRTPGLGHGQGDTKQAKRYHRPSGAAAGTLLTAQPGA
jgi:hypothetical protein